MWVVFCAERFMNSVNFWHIIELTTAEYSHNSRSFRKILCIFKDAWVFSLYYCCLHLKKWSKGKKKKNQFSILGSMWICLCSCIRKSLTVTGCQNIIIRLIEVESPTSAAISPAAITQHGGGDIVKNIYSILNDLLSDFEGVWRLKNDAYSHRTHICITFYCFEFFYVNMR